MSKGYTRPTGHQDARWVGGRLYFVTPEPVMVTVSIRPDTADFASALRSAMGHLS